PSGGYRLSRQSTSLLSSSVMTPPTRGRWWLGASTSTLAFQSSPHRHRVGGGRTVVFIATVLLFITTPGNQVSARSGDATQSDKTSAQLASEGMSAYQKNDYQRAASLLQEAVAKGANDS